MRGALGGGGVPAARIQMEKNYLFIFMDPGWLGRPSGPLCRVVGTPFRYLANFRSTYRHPRGGFSDPGSGEQTVENEVLLRKCDS